MSRCPDALACESRLDEVVQRIGHVLTVRALFDPSASSLSHASMALPHPALALHAHLQVRTHFIANISADGSAVCKHGAIECAGDVQQLCVQQHASPEVFWRFLQCQNADFEGVGE